MEYNRTVFVTFFTVLVYKLVSRIVYMVNNDELHMLKLNKIMFCYVLFYNWFNYKALQFINGIGQMFKANCIHT